MPSLWNATSWGGRAIGPPSDRGASIPRDAGACQWAGRMRASRMRRAEVSVVALGETDAAQAWIGCGGRFPRPLFAAFTNMVPGVDPERFQRSYFDVHRPDSLELDLFTRSLRFEAASPSKVRYLTLWEAEYADLDAALAKIRPAALSLREQGRIWPVQEVVFAQFLFLEGVEAAGAVATGAAPPTLTTVLGDWRAPLAGLG